jgi:hypothetical protein
VASLSNLDPCSMLRTDATDPVNPGTPRRGRAVHGLSGPNMSLTGCARATTATRAPLPRSGAATALARTRGLAEVSIWESRDETAVARAVPTTSVSSRPTAANSWPLDHRILPSFYFDSFLLSCLISFCLPSVPSSLNLPVVLNRIGPVALASESG